MLTGVNGSGDLSFVTLLPERQSGAPVEQVRQLYDELVAHLRDCGDVLLQERIFGTGEHAADVLAARDDALAGLPDLASVPATYIQAESCNGGGCAGIHAVTAHPDPLTVPEILRWRGLPCGRVVNGTDAQYLALSDVSRLTSSSLQSRGADEVETTLTTAAAVMESASWSFRDVQRTWFYLRDILGWYDEFNAVRNKSYHRLGLLNGSAKSVIPASTGIRGDNLRGSWCTLDLLASRPLDHHHHAVTRLTHAVQNEPGDYGSAFSRGLSVTTDRCRYVLVSGTASIDDTGGSVHVGDFDRQAERTLDTLRSLLATAGASFDDICQATVFVKRPADADRLRAILGRHGMSGMPAVWAFADVCRDELLFEIDASAVVPVPESGHEP